MNFILRGNIRCWSRTIQPLSLQYYSRSLLFSTFGKKTQCNSSAIIGEDSEYPLYLRHVEVTTCRNVWEDIPFCRFRVGYVDSHPGQDYDPNRPVIVGLHGTAMTHDDIAPLLQTFVKAGYRIIVPNYPGSPHTESIEKEDDIIFSHKTSVRALFLHDFFKTIKLTRIELMVGFSSGCYSMISLIAQNLDVNIKSMVFLSPLPHKLVSNFRPLSALQFLSRCYDRPFLHFPLKLFAALLKAFLPAIKTYTINQVVLTIRVVANMDVFEVSDNLKAVNSHGLPLLVIYGQKDQLIAKHLDWLDEFAQLLGISEENLTEYDKQGKPLTKGQDTAHKRRITFQKGGHRLQLHNIYKDIVILEIFNFLNLVKTIPNH